MTTRLLTSTTLFLALLLVTCSALSPVGLLAQKGEVSAKEIEEIFAKRAEKIATYLNAGRSFIEKNREFAGYLGGALGDEARKSVETEDGYVLNAPQSCVVDLGASLLANQDHENWNELYRLCLPLIPESKASRLPSIVAFKGFTLKKKKGIWGKIVEILRKEPKIPGGGLTPFSGANPIDDCLLEKGYESAGSDSEISARCDTKDYAPAGIMGNIVFPLQSYLTCVKDQARRGTCVAHATASTVETLSLLDGGTAKNLSEQDIYFEGETETETIAGMFDEGLHTSIVLDHLESSNYQIQLEEEWNYNRATSRGDPKEGLDMVNMVQDYPKSCDGGYSGEKCSDYSSNGDHTFLQPGLPLYATRPSVPANGEEEIASTTVLPIDPVLTWSYSLPVLKALLDAKVPAIMSLSVTDDFKNEDANGYVLYTGITTLEGGSPGGHAMALVGFVPNAMLPPGAPTASYDGFYVFKNSWGIKAADCGFLYIDADYVRNRANYAVTLSIK